MCSLMWGSGRCMCVGGGSGISDGRIASEQYFNDPLSYFSFQPVLHDWCMCYPVCGMVHINEPFLLIGTSRPRGGSRYPLSLSE